MHLVYFRGPLCTGTCLTRDLRSANTFSSSERHHLRRPALRNGQAIQTGEFRVKMSRHLPKELRSLNSTSNVVSSATR